VNIFCMGDGTEKTSWPSRNKLHFLLFFGSHAT
jgi:hypothetical protein